MLEPFSPHGLPASTLRALAVRHGFDLEPQLPDPAPSSLDPEGALHPALTEPLASLHLHSWPTPSARAALVSRLLAEPGRADPHDPHDPFTRLARFSAQRDMEPEVQAALLLLLLRGALERTRDQHRPASPDPAAALRDPDLDVWRHRRARMVDAGVEEVIAQILALAPHMSDAPALAFERATVHAAARWIPLYLAYWDAARHLGPREEIPTEPLALARLQTALAATVAAGGRAMAAGPEFRAGGASAETLPGPRSAVALLDLALRQGARLEATILDRTGARGTPGPVTAKALLSAQIKVLRSLRATRADSLALHTLLRELDVVRLVAHLALRGALLDLWAGDVVGVDPRPAEAALLALVDPPHRTTLYTGLGRARGMLLLRRLRRGDEAGACELAEATLRLAPEELTARITLNDLQCRDRSSWDDALISSLHAERARWDSLSVGLLGARVAGALGDASRARAFRSGLASRALAEPTGERWLLAAHLGLASPGTRGSADAIDALLAVRPPDPGPPGSLALLLGVSGGPEGLALAIDDAELALLEAGVVLVDRQELKGARVTAGGPAVAQPFTGVLRGPPARITAELHRELSEARAGHPPLRVPPLAGALRAFAGALARHAELGLPATLDLVDALEAARAALASALRGAVVPAIDAIRIGTSATHAAARAPRCAALLRELQAARATVRSRDHRDASDRLSALDRLAGELAAVPGVSEPDAVLDAIDEALGVLIMGSDAEAPSPQQPALMRRHAEFDTISTEEFALRPEALRRAHELIRLFNVTGGRRDRKRLRGDASELFELRHRTARHGGLRVFYRTDGDGFLALAAMSKFDDRPQRAAIARVLTLFALPDRSRGG